MGRGWFGGARFPAPAEADFRAHYRRALRGQMRALWYCTTLAWAGAAVLDVVLFPDLLAPLLAFRLAGLAMLLVVDVAATLTERVADSLHATTTIVGTGVSLCTIAMFVITPYPLQLVYLFALTALCIITTIFLSTLHYEYSVIGSIVTAVVFAVCAFTMTSVAPFYAAAMVGVVVITFATSLSCTNTIERYARVTFAQSRALKAQAAAIAEKAQQLEISEGKARDANRAKSVFLSSMSHELRTPLNAVLGFAQFLERETGLSPDGRNNLKIIRRSGEHLLELINDVLAISKIEAGSVTLAEHTFDLHEMIRSVADMIRVRTEQKGLQLIVSVAPDLPKTVVGDDGKLRQVLINLLGNAVKFTDEGGIAVRAEWNGSAAVFELEDTGHGIAEEEMGKLFEAFAQTESGRKSKEGTGLGLAISRSFVRQMGGDIRVRSELGRGTMFTVEAPLAVAERLEAETKVQRVTGLAPGQPSWRLLVVDDTAENRLLLTTLLTTVGFCVREAANGREAIDAWEAWDPHLIWMDMRMPVMDGSEATAEIRRREQSAEHLRSAEYRALSAESEELSPTQHSALSTQHSALPKPCVIVALTASAFEHERTEILSYGVDDFVAKPFREETIFAKLTEHLGVEYVYETDVAAGPDVADEAGDEILTPDRLAALPGGQIRELYDVLSNGDITAAATTANGIREHDDQLGKALLVEIRAFRIDELLSMLEGLEHRA